MKKIYKLITKVDGAPVTEQEANNINELNSPNYIRKCFQMLYPFSKVGESIFVTVSGWQYELIIQRERD